jgi:hypothetical protein
VKDKPLTEFGTRKNKQGRVYPYRSCRACMNAADRANRERCAKKSARCKDCENRENRARMADRRANAALYERTRAKQRADRAAKSAELAISTEITALIRATTARSKTTPPPLPTREQMRAWYYDEECRI